MKVKLRDIIQLNPKERIPKGKIAKKIAMDNLEPYCREIAGYEIAAYKGGTKFRNGDTLLARITPCLENGKTAYVNILEDGEVAFGSTEYFVFRAKEKVIDPLYLYYLSVSNNFRDVAIKSMTGTSGRQRVQKEAVLDYEFDLPNMEEQKKVASIIGSLDDKKLLNEKINDNLFELGIELLSSTKFKEFQSLNDVIEVRDGTHSSPASVSQGGYPLVTSKAIKGISVDFSQTKNISETDYTEINKRSLVEYHDILVSMIGTVGISHLVTENPVKYAIKNVGLIKSSNNRLLAPFLYFYLLSDYGQNYIRESLSGSTQQFISLTNLRKMPIPILSNIPSNLIEHLDRVVLQIENNSTEINTLNSIKHVLLKRYF